MDDTGEPNWKASLVLPFINVSTLQQTQMITNQNTIPPKKCQIMMIFHWTPHNPVPPTKMTRKLITVLIRTGDTNLNSHSKSHQTESSNSCQKGQAGPTKSLEDVATNRIGAISLKHFKTMYCIWAWNERCLNHRKVLWWNHSTSRRNHNFRYLTSEGVRNKRWHRISSRKYTPHCLWIQWHLRLHGKPGVDL